MMEPLICLLACRGLRINIYPTMPELETPHLYHPQAVDCKKSLEYKTLIMVVHWEVVQKMPKHHKTSISN